MGEKTSKEDIVKALGQAQLQGAKEAGKEMAKELGYSAITAPGRANPQVSSALDYVQQQATAVRLNIQRRDPSTGKFSYIKSPGEIDSALLINPGLPEIIENWCGGGDYVIKIQAPGQPEAAQDFSIAGAPQNPGYRAQAAVAAGTPAGIAFDPSHYFGQARPLAPPVDSSAGIMAKMLETMMASQLLQARMPQQSTSNSSEVTELKAQLARMEENNRRAEDERKRADDDRRRQEEMERLRREAAEDRRRSEERFEKMMLEMNKDKTPAWVGLAQLAIPAFAEFSKSKDAGMGLLSQTFGTVLQSQQAAANQQVETFKLLMARPSASDEISKMTSLFAQAQMNNFQAINQMVSSGLLDKGGGNPVVELISQLIEQGGQVLQAAVGNAKEGDGAIAGLPSSNLPPIEAEISESRFVPPLVAPQLKEAPRTFDFNADPSFRVILEQITGNGDPKEIALRLYRHGKPLREDQGHPVAKSWCRDPRAYSDMILAQFNVPQARIDQIVEALLALSVWVGEGKDPEKFATVETRRRRRRSKSIPAISPEAAESFGYSFQELDEGDEGDEDNGGDEGSEGYSAGDDGDDGVEEDFLATTESDNLKVPAETVAEAPRLEAAPSEA